MPPRRRYRTKRTSKSTRPPPAKKAKKRTKRRTVSTKPAAGFSNLICNVLMPHLNQRPARVPDSQMIGSLQMISTTTGTFNPNAVVSDDEKLDYGFVKIFFPGRLAHMVLSPKVDETGAAVINEIPGDTADIINNSDYKADLFDSIKQIRVTGATIKFEYIGNDTSNQGEIVVKKFDPSIDTNIAALDNVPLTVDAICKQTKFMPAKDGFFTYAQKSDHQAYNKFHTPGYLQQGRCLEGLVVWLQGGASDQSWRWTVTQSIEIVPKQGEFMKRFTKDSPPNIPFFEQSYSALVNLMGNANMDIVPAIHENTMRGHCQQTCAKLVTTLGKQLGVNTPALFS